MQDLRRDTLIEQQATAAESTLLQPEPTTTPKRVIACAVDPKSARYVIDWVLDNFIRPETDMIMLMHVRPFDLPVAPYVDTAGYMNEMQEDRDESHRFLKACASQFWHNNIDCKAVSMMGDPKTEIMRKVKDINPDILVMGARKMGTIKRAFLGSVSDHCVHNAQCTVVIAKHPEAMPSPGTQQK